MNDKVISDLLVEYTNRILDSESVAPLPKDFVAEHPGAGGGFLSLLETVYKLREALRPAMQSEEILPQIKMRAKVGFAAPDCELGIIRDEFDEEGVLSENALRAIERAISDLKFRRQFLTNPASVCVQVGLDLTEADLAALSDIKEEEVMTFTRNLDERISKKIIR